VESRVFAARSSPPAARRRRERVMAYDEAIRQGMIEAMERDPRVFVLGEDVGGRYGRARSASRAAWPDSSASSDA
jgi:hypothetical protein